VVAVGPQTLAARRFDVAVIELFGDAQRGEASTRVDGVMVVDRASGVLMRLDLVSAQRSFNLQRRLVRIEPAPEGVHTSLPRPAWALHHRRPHCPHRIIPTRRPTMNPKRLLFPGWPRALR
jgi:hypothetical protein